MTTSELWLEPMIFSLPIPNVTYLQNLRLLSAVSQIQGFLPLSHLTTRLPPVSTCNVPSPHNSLLHVSCVPVSHNSLHMSCVPLPHNRSIPMQHVRLLMQYMTPHVIHTVRVLDSSCNTYSTCARLLMQYIQYVC